MKYLLSILLFCSFGVASAQYYGGMGDGYDSAELNLTTSVFAQDQSFKAVISINDHTLIFENREKSSIKLSVVDLHGRRIYDKKILSQQNIKLVLDQGIYFLVIVNNQVAESMKVIIY